MGQTPADCYGHIQGIPVGHYWQDRRKLREEGVHSSPSNINAGPNGPYSIILHGFKNIDDQGYIFSFSSEEAEKPGFQWRGIFNRCLLDGIDSGNLVRVIRSGNLKSCFAPPDGFRYDGLYRVKSHTQMTKGAKVYLRFILGREDSFIARWLWMPGPAASCCPITVHSSECAVKLYKEEVDLDSDVDVDNSNVVVEVDDDDEGNKPLRLSQAATSDDVIITEFGSLDGHYCSQYHTINEPLVMKMFVTKNAEDDDDIVDVVNDTACATSGLGFISRVQSTSAPCAILGTPQSGVFPQDGASCSTPHQNTSHSFEEVPSHLYVEVPSHSFELAPSQSFELVPSQSFEEVPSHSFEQATSQSFEQATSQSFEQAPSQPLCEASPIVTREESNQLVYTESCTNSSRAEVESFSQSMEGSITPEAVPQRVTPRILPPISLECIVKSEPMSIEDDLANNFHMSEGVSLSPRHAVISDGAADVIMTLDDHPGTRIPVSVTAPEADVKPTISEYVLQQITSDGRQETVMRFTELDYYTKMLSQRLINRDADGDGSNSYTDNMKMDSIKHYFKSLEQQGYNYLRVDERLPSWMLDSYVRKPPAEKSNTCVDGNKSACVCQEYKSNLIQALLGPLVAAKFMEFQEQFLCSCNNANAANLKFEDAALKIHQLIEPLIEKCPSTIVHLLLFLIQQCCSFLNAEKFTDYFDLILRKGNDIENAQAQSSSANVEGTAESCKFWDSADMFTKEDGRCTKKNTSANKKRRGRPSAATRLAANREPTNSAASANIPTIAIPDSEFDDTCHSLISSLEAGVQMPRPKPVPHLNWATNPVNTGSRGFSYADRAAALDKINKLTKRRYTYEASALDDEDLIGFTGSDVKKARHMCLHYQRLRRLIIPSSKGHSSNKVTKRFAVPKPPPPQP